MTDAEYRKLKLRIQSLCKKWREAMGLDWWSISYRYYRQGIPSDEQGSAANWKCCAIATAKWEYLTGSISFDMFSMEEILDEEIERIVVHEHCHILVVEMRMWGSANMSEEKQEEAMKHEERVVCGLTSAFLWTAEMGARSARVPRICKK